MYVAQEIRVHMLTLNFVHGRKDKPRLYQKNGTTLLKGYDSIVQKYNMSPFIYASRRKTIFSIQRQGPACSKARAYWFHEIRALVSYKWDILQTIRVSRFKSKG